MILSTTYQSNNNWPTTILSTTYASKHNWPTTILSTTINQTTTGHPRFCPQLSIKPQLAIHDVVHNLSVKPKLVANHGRKSHHRKFFSSLPKRKCVDPGLDLKKLNLGINVKL
jgi:hypothetical protein